MNIRAHPYDDKQKWIEENTKRIANYQSYVSGDISEQQKSLEYAQEVSKVPSNQSVQGIQSVQGVKNQYYTDHYYQTTHTPFSPNASLDYTSFDYTALNQFIQHVPVESIEDSVVKILEKYGLIPQSVKIDEDNTSDNISDSNSNYFPHCDESKKTFTLDEVIKIIESMDNRLNVNINGSWENKTEQLIDRDKLIQKIKNT